MQHSNSDIEKMINSNVGLVKHLIDTHFLLHRNDEDIMQIGMIGLWKACKSFDPTKSKFASYASVCILNEIGQEFRRRNRYTPSKDKTVKWVVSLDDPVDIEETILIKDIIPDFKDYFEESEVNNVLKEMIDTLRDRDRQIFELLLDDKNQKEIAEIIGISQSYISRIVSRIKKKLKNKLDTMNRY